ncbi:primase-helicase family protein [Massilia aerilata]|uniref:Primase-helicase family protein n=1 Tax=Massilia aerilata TaxID=453817 RepID=A0ABW0S6P9_9BURK
MKTITQLLRTRFAALRALLARIPALLQPTAPLPVGARPAHCGNILTLLAHLCDMDEDVRLWVLRWLAYPLRNPGAKMATALIFNGGEASGKTLFFSRVVAQLYGSNAARIRPSDLYSKFNPWVAGANLVVVDGEYARRHIERLKAMVTGSQVMLDIRGQAPRTVANRLNFIYISSRDDFLPMDTGNRRFVVVEVPPARPRAFYEAIHHEMANGGIDAFRDYLMNGLDMGDFNENTLPPPVLWNDRRAA